MSLEKNIERIADALEKIAEHLAPQVTHQVVTTSEPAAEEKPETVDGKTLPVQGEEKEPEQAAAAETAGPITLESVDRDDINAIRAALDKLGVKYNKNLRSKGLWSILEDFLGNKELASQPKEEPKEEKKKAPAESKAEAEAEPAKKETGRPLPTKEADSPETFQQTAEPIIEETVEIIATKEEVIQDFRKYKNIKGAKAAFELIKSYGCLDVSAVEASGRLSEFHRDVKRGIGG